METKGHRFSLATHSMIRNTKLQLEWMLFSKPTLSSQSAPFIIAVTCLYFDVACYLLGYREKEKNKIHQLGQSTRSTTITLRITLPYQIPFIGKKELEDA